MNVHEKHKNLSLTAKLVPIVAPFVAAGDIRFYLNGINVRPHPDGGAVIAATNGHVLGAIHDPDAVCECEVILTMDKATIAACALRTSGEKRLKLIDGRLTLIDEHDRELHIQAGDPVIDFGNYPQYEKVIPLVEGLIPGLLGSFNASLLAVVEKAGKAANKAFSKKFIPITFYSTNAVSSAVARMSSIPSFVAVLMPLRDETANKALPDWVASTLARSTEASAV